MKALVKITLIGGVLILGWRMDGSWKGAAAWAIVLLFGWVIFQLIQEHPPQQAQAKPVKQFQTTGDFKDTVEKGPSRRGKLNPDPTRPTDDEHAALITVAIERLRSN